ncbi:hypothetical protein [Achromobacter mucicolens]|uniref:hypothetical protein n=1 Tax=Achromobacter mucicolens TaxID=1389922 RepID=UPI00244CA43B|nr:hypothetical protein [Achromobacter mucicolens]MDH1522522.1 hypothetical protein [Achromobacter mucicolens]
MTYPHNPLVRFFEHMPKSGDPELILLKGHLLIEEVLTAIITAGVPKPQLLLKKHMQFEARARTARAVIRGEDRPDLWAAVSSVNSARNALAHGLEPTNTVAAVSSFISAVERQQPDLEQWRDIARQSDVPLLVMALYSVYSQLINLSGVSIMRRNRLLAFALQNYGTSDPSSATTNN